MSNGKLTCAFAAGPPSPPNVALPLPTTVLMVPFGATARIRLLFESAITTVPSGSIAAPDGAPIVAAVAGPPRSRDRRDMPVGEDPAHLVALLVGDQVAAVGEERDASRDGELRARRR